MNCRDSLKKLYEFLDGELERVPATEIETHLDACRHCWGRFEFEKRLKELLQKSSSKETCSEALRSRVQALLEKF